MSEKDEDTSMEEGIIPADAITLDDYVKELEAELVYNDQIIDMLIHRLNEAGLEVCVCGGCIKDWMNEVGKEIQ